MASQFQKDYYRILDVASDADAEDLKRAYRRMVKKYHPDRQPGNADAEELFKELQEAYEVLRDPKRRDHYDTACARSRTGACAGAGPEGQAGERKAGVADFVGDVFEFLKNRMENRGKRGEDLRYVQTVSFEEAVRGAEKVIEIPRWVPCPSCQGRGWNVSEKTPVCQTCRGEGEVTVRDRAGRQVRTCPACGGRGLNEKRPCTRCRGKGRLQKRDRRAVSVPPGVDNGSRLKMRGEGSVGERGGENGDLFVVIQVEDHPEFQRHNLDVWSEVTLHFTQAALGDEIRVSTVDGKTTLTIPPGTQEGAVFTIEGRGVPGLYDPSFRGDHKVRVRVRVPEEVTDEERALLEHWAQMRKP